MLKSGGAVTRMNKDKIVCLAGDIMNDVRPLQPYDEIVCAFLAELSERLRKDKKAVLWPDIMSYAFFCRRANLAKLKADFEDGRLRMGRGVAFHIAPSNVPINSLYTYTFGLLAGNANIVRVSSKDFEQVRIVCRHIEDMFASGRYETVRKMTAIILYEHDREITDELSARASIRVIWGGNATVDEIRKSPIPPRCVELTFADRYSFGIIDPEVVLDSSEVEMQRLAEQFYNDTYLMDQNACSTPHLLIWKSSKDDRIKAGQARFWGALHECAKKYDLEAIKASDKYVQLCSYAAHSDGTYTVDRYENLLYVITLKNLPNDISGLRGKFGLFFQYATDDLNTLADKIEDTVQTCVFYGIQKSEIEGLIKENSIRGIDRIVPIGLALNIGSYWDGYDIVGQMSRMII